MKQQLTKCQKCKLSIDVGGCEFFQECYDLYLFHKRTEDDCPHNEGNIGAYCNRCGENIFNGHGD